MDFGSVFFDPASDLLELRVLLFREKFLLVFTGGFSAPAGLGSRDVDLDLVVGLADIRVVLLLRAVAPEFRRESRLVDDPDRIGIFVGEVTGVGTFSLSLGGPPKLSS